MVHIAHSALAFYRPVLLVYYGDQRGMLVVINEIIPADLLVVISFLHWGGLGFCVHFGSLDCQALEMHEQYSIVS